MAISSNPSISEIFDEFGNVTRTNLNSSFRSAYIKCFGSVTTAVSSSRDFAGKSQPDLNPGTFQKTGAFSMEVDYYIITNGGFNIFVQVEYSTSSSFSSNVTRVTPVGYAGGGSQTQNINGLDPNTTYYVRLRYWNVFNDDADSDHIVTASQSLTTDPPPKFSTPSMLQLYWKSGDEFTAEITGGSADGVWANSYTVQSKDGNGNWQTITNLSNSGWGTSGTKTGRWDLVGNENDPIKVRIRADGQGQIVASNYSGELTVMKQPLNVGLTQPSSGSGQLTASWSNPSGYTGYSIVLQWYLNGSLNATDNLSAGSTSANRTYSDGDAVKVRVRYVGGEYTGFSSEITVSINTTPQPPTGLTTSYFGTTFTASWNPASPTPDNYEVRFRIGFNPYGSWQSTTNTSYDLNDPCSQTFETNPNITVQVRSVIGANTSTAVSDNQQISC